MSQGGQTTWLILLGWIIGPTGVGITVFGWLAKRRLENAKARAIENTAAIDGFDKLVNRLNRDLERRDRELAVKDQRIADLKADLHLVESLLTEERNRKDRQ